MKLALLFLIFAAGLILPGRSDDPADAGYSPWLTAPDFQQWKVDNVKGRHLYCPTIEGRGNNGVPEYRTKPRPIPQGYGVMAVTYKNLDEATYQARVAEYSKMKGFEQTCTQTFVDTQGVKHYQTVFVQLTKKTGGIGEESPANSSPPPPTNSTSQ